MKVVRLVLMAVFIGLSATTAYGQRIPSVSEILGMTSYAKMKAYAQKHPGYQVSESLDGFEKPTVVDIEAKYGSDGKTYVGVDVAVFAKKDVMTWISQLKALGYKTVEGGGEGARGRDWNYARTGKPNVSIWNDYGNTYVLTVYFKPY